MDSVSLSPAIREAMLRKSKQEAKEKREEEETDERSNRIVYRPLGEFELKSMWLFSNTNPIRVGIYKVNARNDKTGGEPSAPQSPLLNPPANHFQTPFRSPSDPLQNVNDPKRRRAMKGFAVEETNQARA
eukprot:7733590-Pyramimonas_sp.AAC.1